MPILHCKIGNHDYFRDPQRGRLPKNCPDHTPEKSVVKLAHVRPYESRETSTEIIARSNLNPELQAALAAAEEEQRYETLFCEVGQHEYRRERKRGKKPANCPEHRSMAISAPPSNKTTDSQARVIASILEAPRAASCRCGLQPTSTPAEIRALGGGCCEPNFVCAVLDTVRRQLNL